MLANVSFNLTVCNTQASSLVFIGHRLEQDALQRALDACTASPDDGAGASCAECDPVEAETPPPRDGVAAIPPRDDAGLRRRAEPVKTAT